MLAIETEDVDLTTQGRRFWTRDTLHEVVERVLGQRAFIVVSNREPYAHRLEGAEIVCERPISGLVAARRILETAG